MSTMREAYQKDMEERLGQLEKEIAQLRHDLSDTSDKARAGLEEELEALKTEYDNLKEHVEKLDLTDDDSAWDEIKSRADEAWQTLQNGFEKAKANIQDTLS